MELTSFLLWAFCIYVGARFVSGAMANHNEVLRQKITTHLDDIIHRVDEQIEGDIKYWYDHDDGEFLGQGRTAEEVIQVLQKRFPKHIFVFKDDHWVAGPEWTMQKIQPGKFLPVVINHINKS